MSSGVSSCCDRYYRASGIGERSSYPIASHNNLVTTLQLRSETKTRLDGVKVHPRETYDEAPNRLLAMAYDLEAPERGDTPEDREDRCRYPGRPVPPTR